MTMRKWRETSSERLISFAGRIPQSLYDRVDRAATGESMRTILIKALYLWIEWKEKEHGVDGS